MQPLGYGANTTRAQAPLQHWQDLDNKADHALSRRCKCGNRENEKMHVAATGSPFPKSSRGRYFFGMGGGV